MCRERKRSSEESGRGGKKKKFANSALPFELVIFLCFHLAGSEGGLKMPNPAIEREREREIERTLGWDDGKGRERISNVADCFLISLNSRRGGNFQGSTRSRSRLTRAQ